MEEEKQKRCRFCGELILAIARKCKHCGEFLDGSQGTQSAPEPSESHKQKPEKTIWTGTPSHFHYLLAYVMGTLLLVAYGLGLIIIIWALLDRRSKVFTVTTRRVMAKSGIMSRSTQEVTMKDIRSINFRQDIFDRIYGLGTVQIGSAGTGDIDVQFSGIPNAQRVKDIISRHKEKG